MEKVLEENAGFGIPRHIWPTLLHKLANEIFDAGSAFSLAQDEDGDYEVVCSSEEPVLASDPNSVWLIDHAWTYTPDKAREQLEAMPELAARMAALVGCEVSEGAGAAVDVDQVLDRLWLFAQTYTIASEMAEEQLPVWYIMDEFGSRFQHADEPNVVFVPLCYAPTQTFYTVFFPCADIASGDLVRRDYVAGVTDATVRAARLAAWFPDIEIPEWHAPQLPLDIATRCEEVLPSAPSAPPVPPTPLKVFSQVTLVREFLKRPEFEIVETAEEADVLWLLQHYRNYEELRATPNRFVSQFPCEAVLTSKDLMAEACKRAHGGRCPPWLPETFNMVTELPALVARYREMEAAGEDTHFIVKPWNLGRSLDTHVTGSLTQLIRLSESGPKIACKYLHNPLLFERPGVGRVKFDVRYCVLVSSVDPLVIHTYNVFWLRFANLPFALERLDEYDRHFTVMNYVNPAQLFQLHHDQFIVEFERQNPTQRWAAVEARIHKAIRELMEAVCSKPAPEGLGSNRQSRAMYAVDLMLVWDEAGSLVPQLLEMNFQPDTLRACRYHPSFYNDCFALLFRGQEQGLPVTRI